MPFIRYYIDVYSVIGLIVTTITDVLTDTEILAEVGDRLRSYRLQQNVTVATVAKRAGLNPNTVVNAEAGKNPRMMTVLRLLRVYGRIESVNAFLPAPPVSPLQLASRRGRPRQRARTRRDG
jgi:transcriptional regulator with XRE-family HTH domain